MATTKFITAISLDPIPSLVADGMVSGTIPATAAYGITHTGPYRHLGNAWSMG